MSTLHFLPFAAAREDLIISQTAAYANQIAAEVVLDRSRVFGIEPARVRQADESSDAPHAGCRPVWPIANGRRRELGVTFSKPVEVPN